MIIIFICIIVSAFNNTVTINKPIIVGNLMKKSLSIFSLCAVAIACNNAIAQEKETTQAQPDGVERMTVYGTTNPIPVINYPGQVSVIDREEIELFNPSSMADLFRDTAGVEFSGGPRRTGETPSIRGRSGENVLILLDGARQSFISAHDGRFFLDPELVQTAEVVKGPASALYGSGAVGGVLAFETVDAADLLKDGSNAGFKYRMGYQDANQESMFGLTGFTKQGDLDLIASISVRNSGDIDLGSGATLSSDDDISTGLIKASYQVTDALNLEFSWQGFNNDAFEPNNGQGVNFDTDNPETNVFKDISSDSVRFAGTFNPQDNALINTQFTLYRTTTEVEETDPSLPRITLRDIETTGFSLRNTSTFDFSNTDAQFTVGLDYYKDEQVGTDDNSDNNIRAGVPNGKATFTGIFAQLELDIDQPLGLPGNLIVIPGVRFDDFENEAPTISIEKNDDNAFSPRLALSYGTTDWLRVFASYSEAFRAPSINELYLTGVHFNIPHPTLFNPQMGSFVFVSNNFVPNPNLDVEESDTIELGLSLDLNDAFVKGDNLQAKASYYQSDIDNLIDINVDVSFDRTCFSPPFLPCSAGTTNSANINSAEIDGYELEAIYDNPNMRVSVTYSNIDGENLANGSDLGVLTPDRLNLDLRWKLNQVNAVIGSRVQLAKSYERTTFNTRTNALEVSETRSGYGVVDFYANWHPEFIDGLTLNLGVDNAFDRDYDRVFAGVSEQARNVKASVSYSYNF